MSTPSPLRVVVLSGPSGAGKTTIVGELLAKSPKPLSLSISATTRPPRPKEQDGDHYHFLSAEEFQRRREAGEFLECAEVHKSGYWYGTLQSEIQRIHELGSWALLEIDVEGALRVMELYPQAISIFLQTPSMAEYEHRLRSRGSESEEVLQRRLRTAENELKFAASYRYCVVNDQLERAVREICEILSQEDAGSHVG